MIGRVVPSSVESPRDVDDLAREHSATYTIPALDPIPRGIDVRHVDRLHARHTVSIFVVYGSVDQKGDRGG